MASKLVTYDIEKINKSLNKKLDEVYEFFTKTFEGVYCSLCDAYMHDFIDFEEKELHISEGFCRTFITKSIHYLLYFHSEYLKYINMAEYFLFSCDHENNFFDKEFPESYAIISD